MRVWEDSRAEGMVCISNLIGPRHTRQPPISYFQPSPNLRNATAPLT